MISEEERSVPVAEWSQLIRKFIRARHPKRNQRNRAEKIHGLGQKLHGNGLTTCGEGSRRERMRVNDGLRLRLLSVKSEMEAYLAARGQPPIERIPGMIDHHKLLRGEMSFAESAGRAEYVVSKPAAQIPFGRADKVTLP